MLGFMMRWLLLGGGLLLSLIGVVWIFQGLDQLGGSFMTGQPFWAWAGLVTLIAGLGILFTAIRIWMRPRH